MLDYNTDFDPAPTDSGPWVRLYAKPSQDGLIPAGAWALSDGANTVIINVSRGFVLDWGNTRTAWVQGTGVPGVVPVKQWNPTRSQFAPRPPGENWQRGFCAPIAYASDAMAYWEQWGAGVWIGFSKMFTALMQVAADQLPKLPVIVLANTRALKFAKGGSREPQFEIRGFVPRPACLPESETAPLPQIAAQPESPPVTYSLPPKAQLAGWEEPAPSAQPTSTPQPSAPAAPIQPASWDEPIPTGTMNMAGKSVPLPGQKPQQPPQEPRDGLLDPDGPAF